MILEATQITHGVGLPEMYGSYKSDVGRCNERLRLLIQHHD